MTTDRTNSFGPARIGILGLGTVGAGTVNVLTRNADEIARRAGREIQIISACARGLSQPRDCDVTGLTLTDDPYSVVDDPGIDVIVELMGGESPAKELILRAIASHKHVVTANKALIAVHGNEIFDAAQRQGVVVAFEAAVAGGISIIKAIREGLAGNRIESLAGIINGTGNYILTNMRDQGAVFEQALAEAQSLGYAEEDPTFDVEGIDAAHKLTILAAIAFGIPLRFDKVYTEGISDITIDDITYAGELGYAIKHLGIARRNGAGVELRVHPALIPKRRLVANVDGVMNAVMVNGDAVGPTLHYGAGAGAEPTASSVVADIVDVVRALTTDPNNRVPHLAFQADAISDMPVAEPEDFETAYFLSMEAIDRPGVLADVTRIFGQLDISIEAILQKEPVDKQKANVIMLTQRTRELDLNQALTQLEELDSILGKVKRIRVEHFGLSRDMTPNQNFALRYTGLIDKYRDRLPLGPDVGAVSLGEGNTPLIKLGAIPKLVPGNVEIYAKFEGMNPTGSFKDRGMTVALTKAVEDGSRAVICASTGNTSASAAAYASRAGLIAFVLIPEGKIALGKLAQAMMHGAKVIQIKGHFDRGMEIVKTLADEVPVTLVNSVNPHRLQGQKTIAFEIVEELGRAPDYHCLPVGNAGNITAHWIGYTECARDAGEDTTTACGFCNGHCGLTQKKVIENRPRLLGYQASGAAPFVRGQFVAEPQTVATAIRIGHPQSWDYARTACKESNGWFSQVTDAEILEAQKLLAEKEGIFCEPASAASLAGLLGDLKREKLEEGSTIVCTITGHGLKDPDIAIKQSAEPVTVAAEEEAVKAILLDHV